jgi:hypothetical protein
MKQFLKSKFSATMVILTMALSISFVSCEGPEGPAGADGLEGAQGVQGVTGAQGPSGPLGATNVIYSPWITNVWVKDEVTKFVSHEIGAPKITQEIMDKGVVIAYFRESSDMDFIKILPTIYYQNSVPVFSIDFSIHIGRLVFFHGASEATNGEGVETTSPNSQIRYILLPGGAAGRVKYPVDFNNYEEVCSYFGIQP